MRYTCDLMDAVCVDRMNTYYLIGLVVTLIILAVVWFVPRRNVHRAKRSETFACLKKCDAHWNALRYECYRDCVKKEFR